MDECISALVLVHHILERDVIDFELDLLVHLFPPHHNCIVSFVLKSFEKSNKGLRVQELGLIVFLKRRYFVLGHP